MLKASSKPPPQTIETKIIFFLQLNTIQTPKYQASRKNTYDLERKSMEMEWKTRNMQFRFNWCKFLPAENQFGTNLRNYEIAEIIES